jgi:hypothetical protein
MNPTKNSTKEIRRIAMTLALAAILLAPLATLAAAASRNEEAQKLFERRIISSWVEGMAMDELVIGARARLTFLYVDAKMGAAIQRLGSSASNSVPAADTVKQLLPYTGGYGRRKGHILFTVSVEAIKHWSFDTADLTVGGYRPAKDDMITGIAGGPRYEISPGLNELPSGYNGMFSFYVPAAHLKPGTDIEIGYGEYVTTWTVPAKNE